MAEPSLSRLADLYGIELDYVDTSGNRRAVGEPSLRALLAAMGCAVATPRQIEASLHEAEERPWRQLIAPVSTHTAARAVVELNLPGGLAGGRMEWRFSDASGTAHEGRVALDDLPVVASRRLDGGTYRRLSWRPRFELGVGGHRLDVRVASSGRLIEGTTRLIVAPRRCLSPSDLGHERLWGLTAQLYGLRSASDWGMGDFSGLGRLAEVAAGLGAATVGINPLHALFPADPSHIGPYSPSSRSFWNVLYIDVEAVPEFADCPAARAMVAEPAWRVRLEAARAAELVDYPAVAALKLPVLERLFAWFQERDLGRKDGSPRAGAYRAFVTQMGEGLHRQACFEALHEHALESGMPWSWAEWPAGLRDPDSAEVEAFARTHRTRIEFYQYLQWLADEQLEGAQNRARAAGMPIGLYHDLAVGVARDGAMTWANPGVAVVGASVGAPPDAFNPFGQNWSLAPLSPVGLRERAYQPLADDLGHNMRHAGALRIDHVMGLRRLYWIPDGAKASEGAYVRYPLPDLVRVLALQSMRHRCLVIGEDLGTVPKGFRQAMNRAGVLSYRLLYFERSPAGGFMAPGRHPAQALVSVSTHDLPTLAGFWVGRDLAWRDQLGLWPDPETAVRAPAERRRDLGRLIGALRRARLLATKDAVTDQDHLPDEILLATHRFLAQGPSALMMLQIEDALGVVDQVNLPGTIDEHPNWRRKLPLSLEDLAAHPTLRRLAEVLNDAGRSWRR